MFKYRGSLSQIYFGSACFSIISLSQMKKLKYSQESSLGIECGKCRAKTHMLICPFCSQSMLFAFPSQFFFMTQFLENLPSVCEVKPGHCLAFLFSRKVCLLILLFFLLEVLQFYSSNPSAVAGSAFSPAHSFPCGLHNSRFLCLNSREQNELCRKKREKIEEDVG